MSGLHQSCLSTYRASLSKAKDYASPRVHPTPSRVPIAGHAGSDPDHYFAPVLTLHGVGPARDYISQKPPRPAARALGDHLLVSRLVWPGSPARDYISQKPPRPMTTCWCLSWRGGAVWPGRNLPGGGRVRGRPVRVRAGFGFGCISRLLRPSPPIAGPRHFRPKRVGESWGAWDFRDAWLGCCVGAICTLPDLGMHLVLLGLCRIWSLDCLFPAAVQKDALFVLSWGDTEQDRPPPCAWVLGRPPLPRECLQLALHPGFSPVSCEFFRALKSMVG